jgi:hypothetical protein
MIRPSTADIGHISWLVDQLRKNFEAKHPEIAKSSEDLREIIAWYDRALLDYYKNPPSDAEGVVLFLAKRFSDLAVLSPVARFKMALRIEELKKIFADGPEKSFHVARDIYFWFYLDDQLLLSRNFLAVYLGDPIKGEAHFTRPWNTVS